MFEQLFQKPSALARHRSAPYPDERTRYLAHCAHEGYSDATLRFKARELLWVARKLSVYSDLRLSLEQIEAVAEGWEERQRCCGQVLNITWTRRRFIEVARPWLRFLGCLIEPVESVPFTEQLAAFATWMTHERGLATTTIERNSDYARQFLRWYGIQQRPFSAIQLTDVDAFLAQGGTKVWSRVSVYNVATGLRAFFRFAATQGWCEPALAQSIQGPRLFSLETLPTGPSWPDVQRLLKNLATDHPKDLRDRAILMLFAIYGFRATEVATLRLGNLDWEQELIHLPRAKRRGTQSYPLVPALGNAIARYLHEVRPRCIHQEVFLTLLPPLRPLSRRSLYTLTQRRLTALGVRCAHLGPHALRHACAARLVSEGLSLKAIGDHLGHRSTAATRIYAKVDLPALHEVAAFDLGGLL